MNNDKTASVYVTRVIDGDTFVGDVPFHILGHVMILKDQHFRMIGINAPEIKGSTKPQGEESRDFLKSLIDGKQILIECNTTDKYGRWLATAIVGGMNVNDYMVLKGFAERRDY